MGLELSYIFGQSPLSEEEKEGLLIKTISTRGELDEFEQQNIEDAVEWTLRQKSSAERILTIDFILEVHRRMFDKTWEWAGSVRKTNKNIGVDTFDILPQLKMLIDDCRYWIRNKEYQPDEVAVRFKHRLVKINPFPNGNGRHSRLCADIIISHIFGGEVFSWGGSDLSRSGSIRKIYIEAIHAADAGDLKPLIRFARSS